MAFVKVNSGNVIDIKKGDHEPTVGIYTGSKNITTQLGDQVIWQFTNEDDKPFGVFGFTALNMAMESMRVGALVRLTYTGTEKRKTKYGMKDVHTVTVEVDDGKESK